MPYRLQAGTPVSRQLSGIVQEELEAALGSLSGDAPDAEAIHDARRRVKRVRAILRLLEWELGRPGDRLTRKLRRGAHALAAMREADANLESLAALQQRWGAALTQAVANRVRRGLESRTRESRAEAGDSLATARTQLASVRARAPALVAKAARRQAVEDGAVRAYGRARRVLATLRPDAADADFHLWRRRLKEHYYHIRLFEGLHPAPRARARALNRLEEALGDDHNLTILADLLLADPRRYGSLPGNALVLGCIAIEQRRLRRAALQQGERSFALRPRAFREQLRSWWQAPAPRTSEAILRPLSSGPHGRFRPAM